MESSAGAAHATRLVRMGALPSRTPRRSEAVSVLSRALEKLNSKNTILRGFPFINHYYHYYLHKLNKQFSQRFPAMWEIVFTFQSWTPKSEEGAPVFSIYVCVAQLWRRSSALRYHFGLSRFVCWPQQRA